jgi:dihydrofolate reductase
MAGFWPASDDEYAKPMNDIPKVVFSRTLTRADWPQSTIASGDLADEISALKREPGKDLIAWGVPPSRSRLPGSAWSTSTGW